MAKPSRTVLTVLDMIPYGRGERGMFALSLEHPSWSDWQPGQFVMIRPESWGQDLLWARPLSICKVQKRCMVLFFQVVGRGTERLGTLKAGDKVTVWGPLGNGFAVEPAKPTLLLAGGIGIAPFVGYAYNHPDPARLFLLLGHKMPANSYPVDILAQRIHLETFHEKTPEDLAHFQEHIRQNMREYHAKDGLVLACGPMPFLRMISLYAQEIGLRVQVSLEKRMACGVGACLGCVAPTSAHWPEAEKAGLPVQTCTKGPVFWADQLDWSGTGVVPL